MTYDYDFEAGTDHPLYADDNVEIECLWNEMMQFHSVIGLVEVEN